MKAVASLVEIEIERTFCEISSVNHAMCLLLEIIIIFRDRDIQIFLNGDVSLSGN